MIEWLRGRTPDSLRRSMLLGGAETLLLPGTELGQARPLVRIGVPTKTYFPTRLSKEFPCRYPSIFCQPPSSAATRSRIGW